MKKINRFKLGIAGCALLFCLSSYSQGSNFYNLFNMSNGDMEVEYLICQSTHNFGPLDDNGVMCSPYRLFLPAKKNENDIHYHLIKIPDQLIPKVLRVDAIIMKATVKSKDGNIVSSGVFNIDGTCRVMLMCNGEEHYRGTIVLDDMKGSPSITCFSTWA
jgi:hypothetical protein